MQAIMLKIKRTSQTAIVQVLNLHKKFKVPKSYADLLRHPFKTEVLIALEDVNFSVAEGSCLGILGPNGAGKTTLMKILSTLIRPTSGEVWIDGVNVEKNSGEVKKIIGCVISDERSFFWRLTGRQNLQFFATLNNLPKKRAMSVIERLVELASLAEDIEKPFQKYSSGMKQKLAIARALLTDPKILLLDEPSKNLDPLFRGRFFTFLKETILDQMKKTVIMATHNTQEVEHLCNDIMVLNKGRVLLHETMKAKPNIEYIFNKMAY
jgi:ABC-2 type transport system ATP-binding protein